MSWSVMPDNVLDANDPGDDVQRRFRYQAIYAASLSLSLIVEDTDIDEIFCEHHEDVLVRHKDGSFNGIQVKTRSAAALFTAMDDEIIRTVARFARHERDFPDAFRCYTIAANRGFHEAADDCRSLAHLIHAANTQGTSLGRREAKWVERVAEEAGVEPDLIRRALSKVKLVVAPGFEDCELRLVDGLSRLPGMNERSVPVLTVLARRLTARTWEASALVHEVPLREYFAMLAGCPISDATIINGKRITAQTVREALSDPREMSALLATLKPWTDLPSGMRALELKLAAGGVSHANISLVRDQKYSCELLLGEWIKKIGLDLARRHLDHLRLMVSTECQEAHDSCSRPDRAYGHDMLQEVRRRVRKRYEEERESLPQGCKYEHLLGIAGILTEGCNLWWSERFDIPTEVTT